MSSIDDLQQRISSALARIGQGIEGLQANAVDQTPEIDALKQELGDEKLASEQLNERLRLVNQKLENQTDRAEQAEKARDDAMLRFEADLQALRNTCDELRTSNEALRAANEQHLADPGQIGGSLRAELESLKAERAAERTEIETIMSELSQAVAASEDGSAELGDA